MAFPPKKTAAPMGVAPMKGNPFAALAGAHGKKKHKGKHPPSSGKPNPFAKGGPPSPPMGSPMPQGAPPMDDEDEDGM